MKILWDVVIQYGREIKTRKLDIFVVNKSERSCAITDIAIPGDIAKRRNREGKNWEISIGYMLGKQGEFSYFSFYFDCMLLV